MPTAPLADVHGNRAYWALLGPDIELLMSEYDVEAAARAVLASGQPSASHVAELLLNPPSAEDWTEAWEAERARRTPRLP